MAVAHYGFTLAITKAERLRFLQQWGTIKTVPEVCRIFCATANPVEVVIAESQLGRGILGIIDGFASKGVEGEEDIAKRKSFLRAVGYKQ
ncbi:MAG: adenosine-specific kinase [Desulfobacteraceae bacterium]